MLFKQIQKYKAGTNPDSPEDAAYFVVDLSQIEAIIPQPIEVDDSMEKLLLKSGQQLDVPIWVEIEQLIDEWEEYKEAQDHQPKGFDIMGMMQGLQGSELQAMLGGLGNMGGVGKSVEEILKEANEE